MSSLLQSAYRHLPSAVYKFNDIVAQRGAGSWVWTSDGRKYLDMNSGIGVTSTGHCHPRVVEAVREQAGLIVHAQQNIFGAHERMVELVGLMEGIFPTHLPRYLFCNSGSEAVDNAVKIARAVTGKQGIIAFDGAFHGRTIGAMALTSSKAIYRQGFGPLMPGVYTAPYPYCLHCKWQEAQGHSGYHLAPYCSPFDDPANRTCCNAPLESLEWMFKMVAHPMDVAALIIEPILGEGGFLTPPPGFLKELRRICTEKGILLIVDEVQSGVARTGRWWGHQHWEGVDPDLLIFAKGIASGYPLAGVAAREGYFETTAPGTLGGTYGGNAVAVAAACATIKAIQEDGMLENATQRGVQLMRGVLELAKNHPIIDVRGRGLMVGLEFGGLDGSRRAPAGIAGAITKAAAARGVLFMPAGAREAMRLLPALNVTDKECDLALQTLDEACSEAFAAAGKAGA